MNKKTENFITHITAVLITMILCINTCIFTGFAEPEKRLIRIPYGYNDFLTLDEDGNADGYYAQYLNALAKINDWKYEYVKTTWAEAMDMLEKGEIDILYPTNYSAERTEIMEFSQIPVGYISVGIFALANSGYKYEDYKSFNNARIAYVKESSNASELKNFAEKYNFSFEPVYCYTNYDIIQALRNGEADIAVFTAANAFPDSILLSVMDAQPTYLTVKKGNTELLTELDYGMKELIRINPDLVSNTFIKTMVGNNNGITAFNDAENKFISSGEEIIVGFYEESEPLAYVKKDGTYDGVYIRILSYLKEKNGLNLVLRPINRYEKWKDLIKSGDIDFYIGASDIAVSNDDDACLTNSFMEYTNLLVTRNDFVLRQSDVPVIAITYGRANWVNYLKSQLDIDFEVKYYRTTKECMLAVVNGEANVTLLNNMEFNYQMKNSRIATLIRWPQYRFPTRVSFAASDKIDNVKLSVLNKAMGQFGDDYIDTLCEEYLNMPYQSYSTTDYIYNSRFMLLTIGLILLACIIIFAVITIYQKKQRNFQEYTQKREQDQLRIMAALSRDYGVIYYTDLDRDRCELIKGSESMPVFHAKNIHSAIMQEYVESRVLPEYAETLLPLSDPDEIIKRFKKEKNFFVRYQVTPLGTKKSYYEMHFVNVSTNDSEHKMVLGVRCVDDVIKEEQTHRQTLQDALDSANRANAAKSDFFSMMSHDIRTPMNAIIGMTAIAKLHIYEPEKVKDALGKISVSSRYLLNLVNDVLDMSKIESGKVHLAEENININKLIYNLVDIIKPQIKEHDHNFTVDIHDIQHENVIGDSLRIQQVFMNLMSNAIKYTPNKGEIKLTVSEKPVKNKLSIGCYEFVLEDNGIGMETDFIQHIFEPFKRAEDLRISKIQGTGLGLPITKNIVQMMNGTIEVESEPGKGSVFTTTIFLKLQDCEHMDSSQAENINESLYSGFSTDGLQNEDFSDYRVLLVEDNMLNREIAKEILEMSKIKVEEAEDGQIAVDMFTGSVSGYYDIIFMDIQMPRMNGYEATCEIRSSNHPDAMRVPIIAMTANAFAEDVKNSKSVGMNEHLSKPINFEKLNNVMKKYLKK